MENKCKFVEYSKIYWDLGKSRIKDTKDIIISNASMPLFAVVVCIVAIAFSICIGSNRLIVFSIVATILAGIVFIFTYRCDYKDLTQYKNNVSTVEKNLGIDFDKFKENYAFLESFINNLKDNNKYINDMVHQDYKFDDWQYIDIILNRFYNGIDKDYYSKLGKMSISLYGNDTLSLLDINRILGDDREYCYNKVVNNLNK